MKLHLPNLLRNAVLACITAVAGISTTLGTAAFMGGVVAFSIAPQAQADSIWIGGTGTKEASAWAAQGNLNLSGGNWAGSGPGTSNSNLWDPIRISGGNEGLVIGSANDKVLLEGWNTRVALDAKTTLYVDTNKFQGNQAGNIWFTANNDSHLYLKRRGGHMDAARFDVGAGSSVDFDVSNGGGALTINLNHASAAFNFVAGSAANYTSAVTVNASIDTSAIGDEWWGTYDLGLTTTNVTLSNLTLNLGEEWTRSETAIDSTNYAQNGGKYYVTVNDGVYSVVFAKHGQPVLFSGNEQRDINLANYANGYQLVFAYNDTNDNKYFSGGVTQIVHSDVQMGETGGDGTTGLIITNGNAGNHQVFTGKLTGNGLIKKAGAGQNNKFTFLGDTSGFEGNIVLSPTAAFTLTFGGSVTQGEVTYKGVQVASSAERGVIGNGNISITSSNATLVFDYASSNAPVYITNKFSTNAEGNTEMHGNLALRGGADYILTQDLSIKGNGKLTIDKTLTTLGDLTLAGTLNLASTDNLEVVIGDDAQSGKKTSLDYIVINTEGEGSVTGGGTYQVNGTANNNAFSVNDAGQLVYTKTYGENQLYLVANGEQNLNADVANNNGLHYVADSGVLLLDSTTADKNKNAISTTKGTGKISIQDGTTIHFSETSIASAFEGDIVINENAHLLLGSDNNDDAKQTRVAELKGGVILNGGRLLFQGKTLNAQRLTSTNDASILRIADMHGDDRLAYFAEVDLQKNLTVQAKYKYTLEFGSLTGAGNLNISSNESVPFMIDSVRDYSGNITVGNNVQAVINLKAGESLNNAQISKTANNASITLTGEGILNVGNTFDSVNTTALNVSLGNGWTGYLGVTGAEITSATSMASSGKVGISDLTVKQGGALTLKGDVWMGGAITLASTLVNESSSLVIDENAIFDLSEMTATKASGSYVYQILSEGDLSALTKDNLADSFLDFLKVKDDATFTFGEDGTLVIGGISMGMEWDQQDDTGNHGSWAVGEMFNGSTEYTDGVEANFGNLHDTNLNTPETVQIVGAVNASRINIAAGQGEVYEFYNKTGVEGGIASATEGIHISSGTAIFRNGTLDLTEDTVIYTQGTLALEAGSLADQEKVDIVLKHAGTLRWEGTNTTDYSLNGGLSINSLPPAATDGTTTIAANNSTVTLDFGSNVVNLTENIYGALQGNTIRMVGNGQTIHAGRNVYGTAGLYLIGVNLDLDAGVQYGNALSNYWNEIVYIASSAGETTTLSGDNSGFHSQVQIGAGTYLELASGSSLGDNMALKGTGHVVYTTGGSSKPVEYTLTPDDTYSGTSTVRYNTTLNWGVVVTDDPENEIFAISAPNRTGAITLDNGSTLVLNYGISNAIGNGLTDPGNTRGEVILTSLRHKYEDGNPIIPIVWKSAGKTYSGLTTITADTIVQTTGSLSTGGGKVNLSAASSVLELTDSSWNGDWTPGHNVYGKGTILLNDSGETFRNVLMEVDIDARLSWTNGAVPLYGIVASGEGNSIANVTIAAGTILEQQGVSTKGTNGLNELQTTNLNDIKTEQKAILNNISAIRVESVTDENGVTTGATFKINGDFSCSGAIENTWYLAGAGAADGSGGTLGALNNTLNASWVSADIVLTDDTLIKSSKNLTIESNTTRGNNHNLTFEATAGSLTWSGSIDGLNQFNISPAGDTTISGAVSNVNTININQNTVKLNGALTNVDEIVVKGGAKLVANNNATRNWSGTKVQLLADNSELFLQQGSSTIGELAVGSETTDAEVIFRTENSNTVQTLNLVTGGGVINMTRNGAANNTMETVLAGDNTFEGTWKISGRNMILTANHSNALAGDTVELQHAQSVLKLGVDNVNLGQLKGTTGTVQGAGKTLVISNNKTTGVDFSGTLADGVNVKMTNGYQKIASANQSGSHTFTVEGGMMDFDGYAAGTNSTLTDTIIAAGGTIKNLTLAAGMTLTQTPLADEITATQDTLVTSKLAGNLTLAGGVMKFYLGADKDGAVNTQYNFNSVETTAAGSAERKLIINSTAQTLLTFSAESSRPYIDDQGVASHDYVLMSGISAVQDENGNELTTADLAGLLSHNFSEEGRAQHSFAVVDGLNNTKSLVLHVVGEAGTLRWEGMDPSNNIQKIWDNHEGDLLPSTKQWEGGEEFYSDDNVIFGVVAVDDDNNPATPDVVIDQVVTVEADGVKVGSMLVEGGNYVFEGGAIGSVLGLGDISITGGDVTFNNSITTKGDISISGGEVAFGVENTYAGDMEISGAAEVTVTNAAALSTTTTTVKGTAELELAATGEQTVSKVDLQGGSIYATEDATLKKLTITGAAALNAETGNTLSATLEGNIGGDLSINTVNSQKGTVQLTMLAGQNATSATNIEVGDGAALVLNGAAAQTLTATGAVKATGADAVVEVTGGMTLAAAEFSGEGTLKLTGSAMSTSSDTVAVDVETTGASKLISTHADGTSMADGKTITLADASAATALAGKWTLKPTDIVWTDDSNAALQVGVAANTSGTVTLTESGSMKNVSVLQNSTLTANTAETAELTVEKFTSKGTVSNIKLILTGKDSNIGGGSTVGDVVLNVAGDNPTQDTALNVNSYDGATNMTSLEILSGRAWIGNYCDNIRIGSIELNGDNAMLDYNSKTSIGAPVTTTLKKGSLAAAGSWNGLVVVDDEDEYRVYDMGNISSNATVQLDSLNVNAETGEYSRLTNVGSLKLGGTDNTITLIDAMKTGDSVFGTNGAVTLAGGAQLHIDINTVLADLLGATDTESKVSTFNLGGNLTGLQNHDNVIFDTALSLFNLKAEFGSDGVLTLTQYAPVGNIYQSTEKQGESTAWNADGKQKYDSAAGYSAILIDQDTTIDLTQEAPAAAQNGLGMVLSNLVGDKTLTITGNGDDLVTISNTVEGITLTEDIVFNTFGGNITVTDSDVQILHTQAHGDAAPTVDTDSTYQVTGSFSLSGGELLVAVGKLDLAGEGNIVLGGVTVADDGQGQLILSGDTTLGGSIDHAPALDMLEATGVKLPGSANAALQTTPHIVLDNTTTLADGAVVEAGVVIEGKAGSVVTVAEGGSATISQAAGLTGAALDLNEGTTLTVDTTELGGNINLSGAEIDGTLASNGEADLKVTQAAGGTSTYAGNLDSYTGKLELAGAGKHKFMTDAAGTDLKVTNSNVELVPDTDDGVLSLRSLEVAQGSTAALDVAVRNSMANTKVDTTDGVTLAGTLNLTANLSTEKEGGVVFTGGTVDVQNSAAINLTINEVSDSLANALINEGQTSVTLAESATGSKVVNITNGDKLVDKYIHNAVVRVENGKLVLTGDVVNSDTVNFHQPLGETVNGIAGATLLDNAYATSTSSINAAKSDMKQVLTHYEKLIVSGNTKGADETLAAVAGASSAVLGMAVHGDIERQLKAIRNRTTTMGVDQSVAHEEMPYVNAWINAEGDHREMSEDGTLGGYEINSWGGTVGVDVDCTPTLTAGLALTAMYGDLDITGADISSGDMDSYYVTAFARYAPSAWTHTFVASVGTSDLSLERTVNYGGGQYTTDSSTSALSFGLMYEVGRVIALDEDGSACLQPVFNVTWRHTTVDGYDESGSDAGLTVGEQTLDTVTFGLGTRLQAVVGESMYNRTSIFECRLLAKMDAGDRSGSTDVALKAYNDIKQKVDSAEAGAFGLEAGAGLTIPMGQEGGSIFMDASLELRSDYTNVNGTVGYRVNF